MLGFPPTLWFPLSLHSWLFQVSWASAPGLNLLFIPLHILSFLLWSCGFGSHLSHNVSQNLCPNLHHSGCPPDTLHGLIVSWNESGQSCTPQSLHISRDGTSITPTAPGNTSNLPWHPPPPSPTPIHSTVSSMTPPPTISQISHHPKPNHSLSHSEFCSLLLVSLLPLFPLQFFPGSQRKKNFKCKSQYVIPPAKRMTSQETKPLLCSHYC